MATPPTYPSSADLVEGTGTRSFGAVTTTAGDWLVVEVIVDNNNTGTTAPVTCTGLTFTIQVTVNQASQGTHTYTTISTAPDATGASRTVTVTPSNANAYRAHLTVVRGSTGVGNTAVNTTGQTASLVRSGDNSGIFMDVGDWNAGAVGSPAWTPGGATTASQQGSGTATYIFGRWDDSGVAATASHGISSPSYTTPSFGALEMLGTAGGPGPSAPLQDVAKPGATWLRRFHHRFLPTPANPDAADAGVPAVGTGIAVAIASASATHVTPSSAAGIAVAIARAATVKVVAATARTCGVATTTAVGRKVFPAAGTTSAAGVIRASTTHVATSTARTVAAGVLSAVTVKKNAGAGTGVGVATVVATATSGTARAGVGTSIAVGVVAATSVKVVAVTARTCGVAIARATAVHRTPSVASTVTAGTIRAVTVKRNATVATDGAVGILAAAAVKRTAGTGRVIAVATAAGLGGHPGASRAAIGVCVGFPVIRGRGHWSIIRPSTGTTTRPSTGTTTRPSTGTTTRPGTGTTARPYTGVTERP